MVKPELYISDERDFWGEDTNDSPGFSMSGWLTNPTDGAFRLPYRADFKFGTGDYTVVQTMNVTASGGTLVASYDDYNAGTGVRFSQISNTFTVDSGPVSVDLPTNIMDGTNRYLLVEREAGVAVRAYVDDFETVTASGADGGADIGNTEPLDLAYDGTTYMDGLLGLTLVFDRTLNIYERDDLFYWIESGYFYQNEPQWIRPEAVLYINPNDLGQRGEYGVRENIVNLAVQPPSDSLYVKYSLTSSDGIENPELHFNQVNIAPLDFYYLRTENGHDVRPKNSIAIGHGLNPFIVNAGSATDTLVQIPIEELGTSWLNNDWTVSFWCKNEQDGLLTDMLYQDGQTVFSITDAANDSIQVFFNNVSIMTTPAPSLAHRRYSMITVTRSGSNFTLYVNAASVDTAVSADTVTPTTDIFYRPSNDGVVGPMHIWSRALSSSQVNALFEATPEVIRSLGPETITVSDSFSYQNFNWERT